jgi:hypothetical protein
MYRYVMMLYYAIINLGTGEIGPVNFEELLFCVVTMIISSMVFTNTFSSIISVYSTLIFESLQHQAEIDSMN